MGRAPALLWCAVFAAASATGLAGCRAAPGAITNAIIGSAIGLGAAGYSRAEGGCYAACPTGTACNEVTGLCEELPCRGQCGTNEVCTEAGVCVGAGGGEPAMGVDEPHPGAPDPER
jgi:hypothetical protein